MPAVVTYARWMTDVNGKNRTRRGNSSLRVALALLAVAVVALVPGTANAKYGPGGGLARGGQSTRTQLGLRGPAGAIGVRPATPSRTGVDWTALGAGLGVAIALGLAGAALAVRTRRPLAARPGVSRPAQV
jgi:hypothetical protein